MRNLFVMEWKKLLRQRKPLLFLLLCLAVVISLTIFTIRGFVNSISVSTNVSYYEGLIQGSEKRIAELKNRMEQSGTDNDPYQMKQLALFERQKEGYKNMADAFKSKDTQKILAANLAETHTALYAMKTNLLFSSRSKAELEEQAAFLQYLSDSQIYIVPYDLSYMNSLYMLYLYINGLFPILFPAVILFMAFNTVTKERSQGTLKFLLQQPYRRSGVLMSKFFSSGATAAIVVLLTCVTQFLLSTLLIGVGDGRYPVPASESIPRAFLLGETSYLSLSNYLLWAGFFTLLAIFFYTALGLFISVISPNPFVAFFLSVLGISVPFLVRSTEIEFPFFISDVNSLLTQNDSLFATAAFYLLAAAALVFLSLSIFKRKNVYR